jgi:transposase
MNTIDQYISEWEDQGHFWSKESEGTGAQRIKADELFPQVLERLQELDELELHSSRRIWDYCVGKFGTDPVAEIIDEL